MKVLIIGGVAAGTKVAAKLKRENRDAEVKILTKGNDISYAGCGLPYYVGGIIETRDELIVNSPEKYAGLTGAEVVTGCEVVSVDPSSHSVNAVKDGQSFSESYDKLVIATGASAFVPDIPGKDLEGVFVMRTPDDAVGLREFALRDNINNFVVVGAGFIGLEIADNLKAQGKNVTVIDFAGQIMPNAFDEEMSIYAKRNLTAEGIKVFTGTGIVSIEGDKSVKSVKTTNGAFNADGVILAIGVRPNTAFLEGTGIATKKGAIVVNDKMETSVKDIYSAGDCALVCNRQTGKHFYSAMGSTANIAGRILAKNLGGEPCSYQGAMGTGVVKISSTLNGGRTGLTEAQAKAEGYKTISVVTVTDDKAHYFAGSSFFVTKLVADQESHRLLGVQVLGQGAVDKMTDIAVVAISAGMKVEDMDSLDLSYAPPFSTAIHPFVTSCYILENKLNGLFETFTPLDYLQGKTKAYRVIDVNPMAKIPGATWVNLAKIGKDGIPGIEKDAKLLLVCARGKRGYFTQNRLKAAGYTATRVLEGGLTVNEVKVDFGSVIPPEEVKRVKGLGCLQDKRQPDHFNVRVITRNGKITTEENRAINEAAEKFGSGEITMTTRLTLEIQGVPFNNIAPLIEFLGQHGLETGGTGSKVRPVVSCKGTTCQYGLIDTFKLSEKLHDLFYTGYHNVELPHKFKLAVGGCPNNCVKPDLNDLGIVGQRMPLFNTAKCRDCKVCTIEKACPIKVAKIVDGKISVNPDECNHCGRCVGKCPFGVTLEHMDGYKIYVGGRWGKKVAHGKSLSRMLTSEEEVLRVVENAILLFRDEGISGERFADTVERLGLDYVEDKILSNKIDKTRIMEKQVKGGATC
jgi:Uncharacterized NAD(FAD)-dependent dehydrogenases